MDDTANRIVKIADLLRRVFQLVGTGADPLVDELLEQLRDVCPPRLDGDQPDLLARLVLYFTPESIGGGWWTAFAGRPFGYALAQELVSSAAISAAATHRPAIDVTADLGWVMALAVETMWVGWPVGNPFIGDASVWGELASLVLVLPECLAIGVACTRVLGWNGSSLAASSARLFNSEQPSTMLFARSWFGNSRGFTHAQLGFSDEHTADIARAVAALTATLHPARARPPPALVRYAQLAGDASDTSDADAIADRLAASDGRESVAALVACGCRGDPDEYQARVLRVLAAGFIRPADALAVIISLKFNRGAALPPAFFDEVALVLAELFAAVDRPREHRPQRTATLDLPPVIV